MSRTSDECAGDRGQREHLLRGWKSDDGAADRVVCVVSDEYLKAPYSTLERHAALWQAAAKRPGFVLLIAVKPCKFPTLSDDLRADANSLVVPEEAARLRFRHFIEYRSQTGRRGQHCLKVLVFAVWNIPIRVPEHFVLTRDDALAEIDGALKRGQG